MVNYYELYGLNPSFHTDKEAVRKKFYELSRQFHPDRFAQGGSDAMDEALKMSAMINDGYKILKDDDALVQYLLQLHGLLAPEEKYALPPAFLMEMMELNEALSDFELDGNEASKQAAIDSWKEQEEAISTTLNTLTARYDNGDNNHELLLQIKDYYFRKKYLLRIQERIAKFALP